MKKLIYLTSVVILCLTQYSCLNTTSKSGTIGINPDSVTVAAGTSQAFSVLLTGALANITVKWSISGQGCSGGSCGTIDQSGNYMAPNTVPANPNIQIIAKDAADPSKFGIANVTIGPAVSVSITQPAANPSTVSSTQTLTFVAKVTNSSNTAVNWSVGGTGCSGAGNPCGMFSVAQTTNGMSTTYTAPNPLPGPTVTVTATSVADSNQTATLTVDLTLLVNVSPASPTVNIFNTQQFSTQVFGLQGSPAATTNWTLSNTGTNCALATNPCGTISASGLYTAPATPPTPAAVTVTASVSQAATNGLLTGSSTATLTVSQCSGGAECQLGGHYAFIYRGYSVSSGAVTPFVEAGSLILDGFGKIAPGSVEDDNDGTTPHSQQAITGTYLFDATDNTRGKITLTSGLVTTMRFVVVPNTSSPFVATTVFLTDFGGTHAGSGTMQQQDKNLFSNATFSGGTAAWAMQVRGDNNAPSAVGRFDVQNAGTNTINAELGRTFGSKTAFGDCGMTTSAITFPAYSNTNTGAISGVTSSGNATLVLANVSVKGAAAASLTFSAYIVTASKLFLVETDSTGFAFVGTAEQQSPTNPSGFTNADFGGVYSLSVSSLNGPGMGNVDHTALHSPGTSSAGTIIIDFGEWGGNLDGTQNLEGLDFEGTTTAFPGGYYSVQSNGLALAAACPGGFMPRYVLYLISPSRAYLWNIDSSTPDLSVTHLADSIGEIDLQQPQLPVQISSMGTVTYAVSFEGVEGVNFTDPHTASTAIAASGVVEFDTPSAGKVTFILDVSRGSQNTGSTPITAVGTYDFSCGTGAVDFDGCQLGTTEDFNWNYAAITGSISFSGSPPFMPALPDHFWFISSDRLLFSHFADNASNIGGLAIKNQ